MIEKLAEICRLIAMYLTMGDYRDWSSQANSNNPIDVYIKCENNSLLTFTIRPCWQDHDRLRIRGLIIHAAFQVTDCREEPEITVSIDPGCWTVAR